MTKKKITRKEDAASIVGENLAEEIELKQKASAHKSDALVDALVEMSETVEETQELIKEIEEIEGKEGENEGEDKEDHIGNSDTIAKTSDAAVEESDALVEEAIAKPGLTAKFEDATMDHALEQPPSYMDDLPYGGATTMNDANGYVAAQKELVLVSDWWYVFQNVAWNIFQRDDVANKREALTTAIDEFKNMLVAKAMTTFSNSVTEKSAVDAHELQPALDALLDSIDNSLQLEADVNGKLIAINPALAELGTHISEYVTDKSKVEPVPQKKDEDNLLTEIKSLVQPLTEAMGILREEVSVLKSQVKAGDPAQVSKSRIPVPRTLTAEIYKNIQPEVKQGSLKDIVRKSVGLN